MDYKMYSFILRSKYRTKIVLALYAERTPSQLSKLTGINLPHVSRALKELMKNKALECVTQDQVLGRIYRLKVQGILIRDMLVRQNKLVSYR